MDAQTNNDQMFQPVDVKIFDRAWIMFMEVPAISGVVKIDVDNVPPEACAASCPGELLQLDAQILPREETREPQRLRMKVQRSLIGLGTRFLNGWLIPDENIDRAKDMLADVKSEYEAWLQPVPREDRPLVARPARDFRSGKKRSVPMHLARPDRRPHAVAFSALPHLGAVDPGLAGRNFGSRCAAVHDRRGDRRPGEDVVDAVKGETSTQRFRSCSAR